MARSGAERLIAAQQADLMKPPFDLESHASTDACLAYIRRVLDEDSTVRIDLLHPAGPTLAGVVLCSPGMVERADTLWHQALAETCVTMLTPDTLRWIASEVRMDAPRTPGGRARLARILDEVADLLAWLPTEDYYKWRTSRKGPPVDP